MNYKILKLVVVFLFLLSCNHKNSSLHKKSQNDTIKIKSQDSSIRIKTVKELYNYNLSQLEKISKSNQRRMNPKAVEPIRFLSKISGIEGSGDMTYYGVFNFSEEDLKKWKNWYKKNKDTLNYIYNPEDTLN